MLLVHRNRAFGGFPALLGIIYKPLLFDPIINISFQGKQRLSEFRSVSINVKITASNAGTRREKTLGVARRNPSLECGVERKLISK